MTTKPQQTALYVSSVAEFTLKLCPVDADISFNVCVHNYRLSFTGPFFDKIMILPCC